MRVAVTGGSGFIGASVVRRLESLGHVATVVDRSTGHDILSAELGDWLAGSEAVIHLAGILGTAELFDNPSAAVDVNIKGSLNVLQACRHHRLRYVGIAMPECWPNVYQATKLCAKRLASAWHENFGVPVSHVRAYNAFGIGQHYGPGHPQKIVPTFSTLAWMGRPIPIWGDGLQLVDMVHVDDIARMLVDVLEFGDDETFDAGTGRPMTVLDVARRVLKITGGKGGVELLPMRAGETPTKVTYARGEGWPKLNWRPVFDEGQFETTVRAYAAKQGISA